MRDILLLILVLFIIFFILGPLCYFLLGVWIKHVINPIYDWLESKGII